MNQMNLYQLLGEYMMSPVQYYVSITSTSHVSVPQSVVGAHGMEFQLTGNPFDTYDIPRSIQSPEYYYDDDETIYDYPLDFDLDDMEIYDYPPDAVELGMDWMNELIDK